MNEQEATRFWANASVVFSEVRSKFGGDDESVRALFESWCKVIRDIDFEDAQRCLDAMQRGDAPLPVYRSEWDKLPAMIRIWCRENRRPRLLQNAQPSQRRILCRVCEDRGEVSVLCPAWAAAHRADYLAREPLGVVWTCTDNPGLYGQIREEFHEARRWCRKLGQPLQTTIACSCDHDRAASRRKRVSEIHQEIFGADAPVSRLPIYAPERFPVLKCHGPIGLNDAMVHWANRKARAKSPALEVTSHPAMEAVTS